MNRRPTGLKTVRAIEGFLQYKTAEGLSPRTIVMYKHDLDLWLEHAGEQDISKFTPQQLRAYISYLLTDYTPRRITGGNDVKLSPKTVRNAWVTLATFFRFASEEFGIPNPMRTVPAPKFTNKVVEPFTREEVEAMIKVCDNCAESKTDRRRKFTMQRATGLRDRAIVMILVDTGLRASELTALRIEDVDVKSGKITGRHGNEGHAKGRKGARRTLWRYLASREDTDDTESPLFFGKFGRPLNSDALRQLIGALGEKAGVKNAHPHRFRHTFAISYLRAGGDLFTLQILLGHSSLEMVQVYARVAQVDAERVHQKASPADNWHL